MQEHWIIRHLRHRLKDLAQQDYQNLDLLKECIVHIEILKKNCSEENQDKALNWLNKPY